MLTVMVIASLEERELVNRLNVHTTPLKRDLKDKGLIWMPTVYVEEFKEELFDIHKFTKNYMVIGCLSPDTVNAFLMSENLCKIVKKSKIRVAIKFRQCVWDVSKRDKDNEAEDGYPFARIQILPRPGYERPDTIVASKDRDTTLSSVAREIRVIIENELGL